MRRGYSPEMTARARGVEQLPIGQHHLQVQHIFSHGSVADGGGARSPSGCHATERGVCTWVWRAESSLGQVPGAAVPQK